MSETRSVPLSRSRLAWAVLLIVVLGGLWYLLSRSSSTPTGPMPRNAWEGPVAVRVVNAEAGDLNVQIKAIGTVTPLNTVTVRSRVDGELARVLFEEGAEVSKGTLLAEIDPDPYQVQLAQAQGQYQQNKAELAGAEQDLALYQTLYKQDSIARQQLTQQQALVNQLRGAVKANQAQVDDARLQLSWTSIEAPIDGRLGLRNVDAGNLVSSGDTDGLVTITQMRPISVVFTVPETQLDAVRNAFATGAAMPVQALDRNGATLLASGRLTTLDNRIDTATGTLRLRAEFANEKNELFPNQFVNVRLQLRTLPDAVTIPTDAVQYGSQGTYVYVIEDQKAQLRPITLGPVDGDRIAVSEGLADGEVVVLEGMERLRDGRDVILVEGDSQPVAPAGAGEGATGGRRGGGQGGRP
ncbi:multidrug efflux system membrane fusion protein [Alloalcanivorax xenomutans]|uniref:efflux RND transporter periplasmic adaptor subunit n=1 Tax=Alloalcanivorax xenomutans TaxID=1094342 RepID=UPI000BD3639D|nr:efflux RND transporter periplasmic adaptor subunit [Alloalcanivorax xenomutans]SOB96108.1 multidrug efflux system membrane fusion protein [Alloalcanivorax xenomutans]